MHARYVTRAHFSITRGMSSTMTVTVQMTIENNTMTTRYDGDGDSVHRLMSLHRVGNANRVRRNSSRPDRRDAKEKICTENIRMIFLIYIRFVFFSKIRHSNFFLKTFWLTMNSVLFFSKSH